MLENPVHCDECSDEKCFDLKTAVNLKRLLALDVPAVFLPPLASLQRGLAPAKKVCIPYQDGP